MIKIAHAKGQAVWTQSGRRFIDYTSPYNLVGYGDRDISEAVFQQLKKGLSHTTQHLEEKYTDKIRGYFPHIEECRFFTSEGDALASLAKCHTMIVEPVTKDYGPERIRELGDYRTLCDDSGMTLVFNEMRSAFRFPRMSVSGWCGVNPDVTIMGHAIGGGLPLYVVGGKRSHMKGPPPSSGSALAVAAGLALIEVIENHHPVQRMWDAAETFKTEFNSIAPHIVRLDGYPTAPYFVGDGCELFFSEAEKAQLLFKRDLFWMNPLHEETFNTISIARVILSRLEEKETRLEGAYQTPKELQGVLM